MKHLKHILENIGELAVKKYTGNRGESTHINHDLNNDIENPDAKALQNHIMSHAANEPMDLYHGMKHAPNPVDGVVHTKSFISATDTPEDAALYAKPDHTSSFHYHPELNKPVHILHISVPKGTKGVYRVPSNLHNAPENETIIHHGSRINITGQSTIHPAGTLHPTKDIVIHHGILQ